MLSVKGLWQLSNYQDDTGFISWHVDHFSFFFGGWWGGVRFEVGGPPHTPYLVTLGERRIKKCLIFEIHENKTISQRSALYLQISLSYIHFHESSWAKSLFLNRN